MNVPCTKVIHDGDNYEKEDLEILAQSWVFSWGWENYVENKFILLLHGKLHIDSLVSLFITSKISHLPVDDNFDFKKKINKNYKANFLLKLSFLTDNLWSWGWESLFQYKVRLIGFEMLLKQCFLQAGSLWLLWVRFLVAVRSPGRVWHSVQFQYHRSVWLPLTVAHMLL